MYELDTSRNVLRSLVQRRHCMSYTSLSAAAPGPETSLFYTTRNRRRGRFQLSRVQHLKYSKQCTKYNSSPIFRANKESAFDFLFQCLLHGITSLDERSYLHTVPQNNMNFGSYSFKKTFCVRLPFPMPSSWYYVTNNVWMWMTGG
jgi:hypothetical protein